MIQYEPEGDDGFGYDPVVYLPSFNRTVAQLSLEQKNQISHRGCAAARALTVLVRLSP
jgi:XTP/dITP diphosphohydrolase